MSADAKTSGEVEAAITRMADAYHARNLKDLLACFASDRDVTLIGTGADEKRIGLDQIQAQAERDWAQTESIAMSFTSTSISSAGPVAWVCADGAFHIRAGGQSMALPARITLVLENRSSQWLIVHAHFSTPAAGQEAGASV